MYFGAMDICKCKQCKCRQFDVSNVTAGWRQRCRRSMVALRWWALQQVPRFQDQLPWGGLGNASGKSATHNLQSSQCSQPIPRLPASPHQYQSCDHRDSACCKPTNSFSLMCCQACKCGMLANPSEKGREVVCLEVTRDEARYVAFSVPTTEVVTSIWLGFATGHGGASWNSLHAADQSTQEHEHAFLTSSSSSSRFVLC